MTISFVGNARIYIIYYSFATSSTICSTSSTLHIRIERTAPQL